MKDERAFLQKAFDRFVRCSNDEHLLKPSQLAPCALGDGGGDGNDKRFNLEKVVI